MIVIPHLQLDFTRVELGQEILEHLHFLEQYPNRQAPACPAVRICTENIMKSNVLAPVSFLICDRKNGQAETGTRLRWELEGDHDSDS